MFGVAFQRLRAHEAQALKPHSTLPCGKTSRVYINAASVYVDKDICLTVDLFGDHHKGSLWYVDDIWLNNGASDNGTFAYGLQCLLCCTVLHFGACSDIIHCGRRQTVIVLLRTPLRWSPTSHPRQTAPSRHVGSPDPSPRLRRAARSTCCCSRPHYGWSELSCRTRHCATRNL